MNMLTVNMPYCRLHADPIGEINKYDFRNAEKYVFKSRKGLDRDDRRRNLGDEARAGVDAGLPAEEPGDLRVQARPPLGRRHRASSSRTSTTI